jgi:ATPase subunit of ABC transporter with duplicated ATPase domains
VICPQTAETITNEIRSFAAAIDSVSRRLHGELSLEVSELERWPTLSAGERKRWQVGAALAREPDVLMLDEPTDHLDREAREILIASLGRFDRIGIVVSHDRALLEALCSHTVRVAAGTARIWRGAHRIAKSAWEAEERTHHAEYDRLKRERATLARRLADKRRSMLSSAAGTGTRKRMKGPRDHDATERRAKGRAQMGLARVSRDAGILRASVDRVGDRLSQFEFRKEKGRGIFIDWIDAPCAKVMTVDEPAIAAGGVAILRDVHLALERTSRVHIAGLNGAGKSTLMRAMLAGAHVARDRILHLPQELSSREGIAMLDSIRALAEAERGRVLSMAAALGIDPERILDSRSPSPGEVRKIALAFGLGRQAWALVLDEPTNHLDMPAIERLENALAEYPGALAIITHDDELASRCTNQVWRAADGIVTVE